MLAAVARFRRLTLELLRDEAKASTAPADLDPLLDELAGCDALLSRADGVTSG